jgi:hypothetical protein
MKTGNVMPITRVFVLIFDPHSARQTRHDLAELLIVVVCAVSSGVDELADIELWANSVLWPKLSRALRGLSGHPRRNHRGLRILGHHLATI